MENSRPPRCCSSRQMSWSAGRPIAPLAVEGGLLVSPPLGIDKTKSSPSPSGKSCPRRPTLPPLAGTDTASV
eukprot:6345081-Pyramimonas_sp.AAC.1